MEIKLKGREMPRGADGSVKFKSIAQILTVFNDEEGTELVNRAIYQLEYQRESHRKRGQAQRDLMKATKEALEKAGVDVEAKRVSDELEGK